MTREIVPIRTYVFVFAALIALTATTVIAARVELGALNFIVAMTIAVLKASLVVWFFMHLRQSASLVRLFALAGLFWMAILLVLTLSDYLSRGWPPPASWWTRS